MRCLEIPLYLVEVKFEKIYLTSDLMEEIDFSNYFLYKRMKGPVQRGYNLIGKNLLYAQEVFRKLLLQKQKYSMLPLEFIQLMYCCLTWSERKLQNIWSFKYLFGTALSGTRLLWVDRYGFICTPKIPTSSNIFLSVVMLLKHHNLRYLHQLFKPREGKIRTFHS